MRKITKIIIHCSDSEFGCRNVIEDWHQKRRFRKIGYHYVICNGYLKNTKNYSESMDGQIQEGRSVGLTGAHVKGHNSDSLGICLIGTTKFSQKQTESLLSLIKALMILFEVPVDNILGHYELDQNKTCPNMNMDEIRKILK